jgi:5-enolpyruvylshikimate-3-phosphate synthase
MNSKTILGISFTTVFALSIISAVTAIQADAVFKVKHLPDFKTTESNNIETVKTGISNENLDFTSFNDEIQISDSSILNKQLKN